MAMLMKKEVLLPRGFAASPKLEDMRTAADAFIFANPALALKQSRRSAPACENEAMWDVPCPHTPKRRRNRKRPSCSIELGNGGLFGDRSMFDHMRRFNITHAPGVGLLDGHPLFIGHPYAPPDQTRIERLSEVGLSLRVAPPTHSWYNPGCTSLIVLMPEEYEHYLTLDYPAPPTRLSKNMQRIYKASCGHDWDFVPERGRWRCVFCGAATDRSDKPTLRGGDTIIRE